MKNGKESPNYGSDEYVEILRNYIQYVNLLKEDWYRIVNDTLSIYDDNLEILAQIIEYLKTTDSATVEGLSHCYDTSVVVIDSITLRKYSERWNRTVNYSRYGWVHPTLVPEGYSLDFYYPDSNNMVALENMMNYALAKGFSSMEELFIATKSDIISSPPKKSQCASISLKLSQDFAMTREAFTGTLSIKNPHDSISLNDLVTVFFFFFFLGNSSP